MVLMYSLTVSALDVFSMSSSSCSQMLLNVGLGQRWGEQSSCIGVSGGGLRDLNPSLLSYATFLTPSQGTFGGWEHWYWELWSQK